MTLLDGLYASAVLVCTAGGGLIGWVVRGWREDARQPAPVQPPAAETVVLPRVAAAGPVWVPHRRPAPTRRPRPYPPPNGYAPGRTPVPRQGEEDR